MNQRKLLPLSALILGLACLAGRWTLYHTAVDAAGLLVAPTPLEWGTYLLTVLALILFAAASRREEGKILPDSATFLGQCIGALGLGWTTVRYAGEMPGLPGYLWRILGMASALCLALTALWGIRKKEPPFLLLLMPCLFWLAHLIDNYRGWSGTPQLQGYVFSLLAAMAMTLFTYCTAAEAARMGKPRRKRFAAMAAGYFCAAAALPGKGQLLYLLSALWALSSL